MMTLSAETQNAMRKLAGKGPAPEAGRAADGLRRGQPAASRADEFRETARLLRDELDGIRHEHEKLQQAVYEAAQIQRRLCAPRELIVNEFEIAGEIFPVRHLSGDFFKVIKLDSMLGIVVGDIAGKGFSAGIWQAHLMDLVERCARTELPPAEVVAAVNRDLCQDRNEPPIAGLFFARLDPVSGELAYSNAGLPPPLLLRGDKSVEKLEKGGPMLGALKESKYDAGTVTMNPGDLLLAYSDGLTECRNSLEEEFEVERLVAAAKATGGATANQVLFSTLAAVLNFADTCSPEDDLTLLVIRRREAIAPERPASGSQAGARPPSRPSSDPRPKQTRKKARTSSDSLKK